MKPILSFFLLVIGPMLTGQETLDTIYANEHMNVALFFPEPIRQGITGASNFVFTYNRSDGQHFGLLKANPGKTSNLLTITEDGSVYSYILKYDSTLPQINYFLKPHFSIGNEKPIANEKPEVSPIINSGNILKNYEELYAKTLLLKARERIKSVKKQGVQLRIEQIAHHRDQVYFVLTIRNTSKIDFEIEYLECFVQTSQNTRKASNQKLVIPFIYTYRKPSIVKQNESHRFVLATSKFVLGRNNTLLLELKEKKGNRRLNIKI